MYNCRDTWAEVQSRGDVWEIPPGSDLSLEDGSLMGVEAEEAAEQNSFVQGTLRGNASFWLNELDPSSSVTEIVTTRYRLPFMRLPDPVCELNRKSALGNATFVTAAIKQLVAGRCVSCCMACLVVCSPCIVGSYQC